MTNFKEGGKQLYTDILIRYGELSIKGKNKKLFIQKLYERLKEVFPKDSGVEITTNPVRAFLSLPEGADVQETLAKLKTVFGLTSASLAIRTESTIEAIKEAALKIVETECAENSTLKIDVNRVDKKFPRTSPEITKDIAAYLFINNTKKLRADVHNPDKEVTVEIRHDYSYVMLDKLVLPGGFPQGSIGKGLLMLSGGIDSPVAGYLAMRKGINIAAIHFASPPYTSDNALNKIKSLVTIMEHYQQHIPLYVVPFTDIQLEIVKHVQDRYQMIVMRRIMYMIADQVARMHHRKVLINGESVGQVASQTLESMGSVHPVTDLPIFQPVSSYEKNEIIAIAKEIGTYETSILPFEDCCTIFVPKNPVTKPKKRIAEFETEKLDVATLIEVAIAGIETVDVKEKVKNNTEFL